MTSRLIRHGWDWFAVSMQGRVGALAFDRLVQAKQEALETGEPVLVEIAGVEGLVRPTGTEGGYSIIFDMGPDKYVLLLKSDRQLIDDPYSGKGWNIRFEARAAMLATVGIDAVITEWRAHLGTWGSIVTNEKVSRADYCIDILDNDFVLDLDKIIAPPRMSGHDYFDDDAIDLDGSSFNGRRRTSVRMGGRKNYQFVAYDKTLEVNRGKAGTEHWRSIWGDAVGKKDRIWRIEFRASGEFLKKFQVRSMRDVLENAQKIFGYISSRIRIVSGDDLNVSRRRISDLWKIVQETIKNLSCCGDAPDGPVDIRLVRRERAIGVISSMLIGLSATYQSLTGEVCKKVSRDAVFALLERFQNENGQDYSRKVARAHRRYVFIT